MSSSIGDTFNLLSLELSKVQGEIEKVEGEMARVATKIENEEHLSPDEKSDWKEKLLMEEKKQLRDKEKQLMDEKKLLMQKEMQLRASGEGGRPPTHQAQDDDIQGTLKLVVQKLDDQSNSVIDLGKKIDDFATESQAMSKATLNFTRSLYHELNMDFSVCSLADETGDGALDMYPWGEDEGEEQGQPGCKAILENEVLPFQGDNGVPLGFFDVRNRSLPELKGGKYKSNGFSDLALGDARSIQHATQHNEDLVLAYADALVELKKDNSQLKKGELLLQLASASLLSNKKKGVVVLGTDCATK